MNETPLEALRKAVESLEDSVDRIVNRLPLEERAAARPLVEAKIVEVFIRGAHEQLPPNYEHKGH